MKPPSPKRYPPLLPINRRLYHCILYGRLTDDDHGWCDDAHKVIALSLNQDRVELFKSLVHEWLHGANKEYKMKISHSDIRKMEEALWEQLPIWLEMFR